LEHNTHFTLANFWLGKEVHQFVASVVSSTQMQLSVSFHTQLVGKKLVGGIPGLIARIANVSLT